MTEHAAEDRATDRALPAKPAPSSFRDRFDEANRLWEAGEPAKAEAAFLRLLDEDPESAALLCRLGSLRARAGDRETAAVLYRRAIESDPIFPWSHIGLAEILEAEGAPEEAVLALEEAAAVAPELSWLPPRIDDLRRRMEAEHATPPVSGRSFRERFDEANALFEEGDLARAEAVYLDLLQEDSRSAALLCKLASVNLRQERHDDAYQLFDRATRLDPDFPWSYVGLADLHEAEGRPGEALVALEAAQAVDGTLAVLDDRIERLRREALRTPPARVLIADGTEDAWGRALLLISALHLAAPRLGRTLVRFVQVRTDPVRAAIQALAWDVGLEVETAGSEPAETAAALSGAAGYAAVAFRQIDHLDPFRAEAERIGLPRLVAVQFPDSRASGSTFALERAAHDPRRLADEIVRMLEPQ